MADKENKRKCFKCGSSPAVDNVKLFRFPKPAVKNILRCTLWAKYLFPAEEQYTSLAFQAKLHNEHRMLCEKHFNDDDFTDGSKKKLFRTAVPCDTKKVSIIFPSYSVESQAGPSQIIAATPQAMSNKEQPQISQRISNNVESEKERCLLEKCKTYMRKVCQLRNRIKNIKAKVQLNVLSDNNAVRKLSAKITPTFALLLQSQLRNFKKKATGYRWTKEDKIIALRLYKRSPTCYRLLRRLFRLPSPGTLKALLNRVPFGVGINKPVFKVLADFVKTMKPSDNQFVLIFDEMSLKKHVMYNPKEDLIEGYQDHGTQGRSPAIASYALVFMIVGIRKTVKQPIAHYFSSAFSTADRLAVLIKEVLNQCFQAGINICATVCDMNGVNRRALSILGANVQQPYFAFNNKEVVTIFDTPHLLKCFRNLFMKYDIQCRTNISSGTEIGTGVAKWSHIKEFFDVDKNPNFVFAPALTKDYLDPNPKQKMRVKLAAQVLSHTVAAGIYAKIADGALTTEAAVTANVVSNIDKLFDCLNSDTADLRRGKIHATNMTLKSPHMSFFSEMKVFFKTMKFVGCSRQPPSLDGWIWTINGVERLFLHLSKAYNIRSLATRRLQQDPIENLFGCIRGNCGSNTNPTTGQFVAGLKTSILSSLAHIGTIGSNCERDNNVIINNLSKLLSSSQSTLIHAEPEFHAISELPDVRVIEQNIDEGNAEVQACAYVCGFMLKQLSIDKCEKCRNFFVSDTIDKCHLFVECREYSDFNRSLCYVTKGLITYVEQCASLINSYLRENEHTSSLKKILVEYIKKSTNFDFVKECMLHSDQNINNLINSVLIICLKRFCVVKNRLFAEEASTAALRRKMNIMLHR